MWYRFAGRQMGMITNNGGWEGSYAASVAQRQAAPATTAPGAFANGATVGKQEEQFSSNLEVINSYSQGSVAGSYVVRSGDSLQAIAQNLWGDSGLWYKLAEANGLSGAASLFEGQTLRLPAGVMRNTYNASSVTPYNPAETLGDVTPSTPQAVPPKKQKCGGFGQILLVIIAVVVTVVSHGAAAGFAANILGLSGTTLAVAGGAMAAAAGSVVSQLVGVATGIQEKFDWKGVALAAISGGVGGGLGQVAALNGGLSTATRAFQAGVRGALGSAISQGIGVALGLQDKFSWAAVAAAGVGGAVGQFGAEKFPGGVKYTAEGKLVEGSKATLWNETLSTGASLIANATTRTLIEGTDFGDNVIAALPDSLGGFVGRRIGGAIQDGIRRNQRIDGLVAETGRSRSEVKQWVKDAEATGLDLAGRATNPRPQAEKARQNAENARRSEQEIKQELLARRERFDRLQASLEKAGRADGPWFQQFKRTYEAALLSVVRTFGTDG